MSRRGDPERIFEAQRAGVRGRLTGTGMQPVGTLKRARAYYKAAAKIEGDFITALRQIVVPADSAGDVHTKIVRDTATQALLLEGSVTKSWVHLNGLTRDLQKALRASTAAANLVRSDLGLPPVPVS